MKIKTTTTLLAFILCAGCSNSNDRAKIEALSQKLDAISSNQTLIINELVAESTNLPNEFNSTDYYYHTNTINFMVFQQQEIQDAVNAETRRVSVIMFTNFAGFQADTLEALNQIKLSEPDVAENAKRIKMEADIEQIKRDLDNIKVRLGITY